MFNKPVKIMECPCGHVAKAGFEPLTCPNCLNPFPQSGKDFVHASSLERALRDEESVSLAKRSQRTFKKRERTEVVLSSTHTEWTEEKKAAHDKWAEDFGEYE